VGDEVGDELPQGLPLKPDRFVTPAGERVS
jgi:hypothetical protein